MEKMLNLNHTNFFKVQLGGFSTLLEGGMGVSRKVFVFLMQNNLFVSDTR